MQLTYKNNKKPAYFATELHIINISTMQTISWIEFYA